MAAVLTPPQEVRHPSIPGPPETTSASRQAHSRSASLSGFETSNQTAQSRVLPSINTSLPNSRTGRSQTLSTEGGAAGGAGAANSPIRRKPLASRASPSAVRSSLRDQQETLVTLDDSSSREQQEQDNLPALELRSSTSFFLESPILSSPVPQLPVRLSSPETDTESLVGRNIPDTPVGAAQTQTDAQTKDDLTGDVANSTLQERDSGPPASPERASYNPNSNSMSLSARKTVPPHLDLDNVTTDIHSRSTNPIVTASAAPPAAATETTTTTTISAAGSPVSTYLDVDKPLPKSPTSSKLGTFFGWNSSPSSSNFSDKGFSPLPSPYSPHLPTVAPHANGHLPHPSGLQIRKTNALASALTVDYFEAYSTTPPAAGQVPHQIDEMEDELKAISAELAASIRREMDLEDLVDRLQEQVNNPQAPGRRNSDYFSDSGYSSAKFSDYDHVKEEISQVQRRSEQEKAKIRLELTTKLQDERSRRSVLDQQIKELSERASQINLEQVASRDASGRVKELESACEDLRRRLSEERQVKDNFEDLLSALKGELNNTANERDNLRDEIVPSLRARVEGLEAEAASQAKLAYDTTKMQQELQTLKTENTELRQSHTDPVSAGLARSASVAGGTYKKNRPPSLARANTTKQTESKEALTDRLKDVEAQRDALHVALKSLLERQEFQNRENEKKIRVLEVERERLLASSPKKAGYEKEVSNLRDEINVLRRRAEEAVEQKWQVEKGLGGLKMDLDRAEQEIASLRALLKESDILIPVNLSQSSSGSSNASRGSDSLLGVPAAATGKPVTSGSLEEAYRDLQRAYADAIARIKALETGTMTDEKTKLAMQRLEQSLAGTVSQRDSTQQEAQVLRTQVDSLQASEKAHFEAERNLADQLRDSARRVEELAQQVRTQLATNAALRTRLSDTVARGESEQRVSKERIVAMQSRLKTLEEELVAAQTASEERVAKHEEELTSLKDAHSVQLQRLRDATGGLRSPRQFPAKSPLSPLFGANGRSPRLSPSRPPVRRSVTTPVSGVFPSKEELNNVAALKARVTELEGALASADAEMQEVVGRMNTAQIEVMTLQEEREEAVRETRRLQRAIEQEKVRAFEERFKTITSEVR